MTEILAGLQHVPQLSSSEIAVRVEARLRVRELALGGFMTNIH
jgi:hypothetical protein